LAVPLPVKCPHAHYAPARDLINRPERSLHVQPFGVASIHGWPVSQYAARPPRCQ